MDRDNQIDIYTLPPNFAEEGTVFSGRIKTRNAVETAVILVVLLPLLFSVDTTVKVKMYLGMIVFVPIVVLAVIGIQGESLFAFIASFFRYLRRRRCLTIPDERYRMEQNRKKEKAQKGEARIYEKKTGRGGKHKKNPKAEKPRVEETFEADKERIKTRTIHKAEESEAKQQTEKRRKKRKR